MSGAVGLARQDVMGYKYLILVWIFDAVQYIKPIPELEDQIDAKLKRKNSRYK